MRHERIIIQSQNIHGLYESDKDKYGRAMRGKRTYVKLELIRNLMIKKGIDIYLLQEIWHEGTDSRDIGDGFVFFHHNTTRKQDRTGVGIISWMLGVKVVVTNLPIVMNLLVDSLVSS